MSNELETTPEPPVATPETKRRRKERDGWSLLEKFFGLVTALLTLLTAAIGLWGLNAASERDDLKEETSSLEDDTTDLEAERDELAADLDAANTRIDELEAAAASPPEDDGGTTSTTRPTAQQLLTDLEPSANQNWSVKTGIYVNEGFHDDALASSQVGYCSSITSADQTIEYSLRAQYETLTAAIGVMEESDANRPVRVEIVGDDRVLWTNNVQVGQKYDAEIEVTGVIRLKIVATKQFDNDPGACDRVFAALGDPTLTPSSP